MKPKPLCCIDTVTRFTVTTEGGAMMRVKLVSILCTVGLFLALIGCAETSTQRMINANDHAGLANYYAQQAQELRAKAKQWEHTAEYYEKHSEPHGKTEPKQHAAHCRAIAQISLKAAEEAEALAQEHREVRPHGMIQ